MAGKKSQASMEFFFVIGTIIFFFIILSWIVVERKSETKETKEFLDKRDACIKIVNSINSVYSGKDGSTLKISNFKYGINITPAYRTVEIYEPGNRKDFVTCSLPVEKVVYYYPEAGYNGSVEKYEETLAGYGSTFSSFEINSTAIQLKNIEDRVFIGKTCSLNEVDYAEGEALDGTFRPLTNPVKRLDGDIFTLIAAGEGTMPGDYLFNVAYVKLGSPWCLLTVLEEVGYIGNNTCTFYDDPQCRDPQGACNIFKSTSVARNCLFSPAETNFTNWYTLFLYEDVQNLDATQLGVFQDRVSRAGWALLSGEILDSIQGYAFGAYLYNNYGTGIAQHIGDDPEGLLELTEPTIDFTGYTGSATNPNNLADYMPLYNFISYPNNTAIARWNYPDNTGLHGDVYYFTDYCTVKEAIKELVKKVLSIEYYTWAYNEFKLTKQVGAAVPAQNPINIYVAHEITDLNYQGKTSWISRIDWCNLDTGCTSWSTIEVGEAPGICENHVSAYNNKKIAKCTISLGNPNIENIGLKIKFSAPSGSGRVPINVDFIQVETCY